MSNKPATNTKLSSAEQQARIQTEQRIGLDEKKTKHDQERLDRLLKRDLTASSAISTIASTSSFTMTDAEQKAAIVKYKEMEVKYYENIEKDRVKEENRSLLLVQAQKELVMEQKALKQLELDALRYTSGNHETSASTSTRPHVQYKLGPNHPLFSGLTSDTMPIRQWIMLTEVSLKVLNVSKELKAYVAGQCLRESAQNNFLALTLSHPNEDLTWEELKEHLYSIFEPKNIQSVIFKK